MTSSPHGPYGLGYTRATMAVTMGCKGAAGADPKKPSQFGLHSATRVQKVESLVIEDQHASVNTFPGLVHTARHAMGVGSTRRWCANRKEAASHGRINDWGEVVTR